MGRGLSTTERIVLRFLMGGAVEYLAVGREMAEVLDLKLRYHPSILAILVRLSKRGLVKQEQGKWQLTPFGETVAAHLR